MLQQYLPFTVLKQGKPVGCVVSLSLVATVLTVYGIETLIEFSIRSLSQRWLQQYLPFTVLKLSFILASSKPFSIVATVLTVYGIETL